MKILMTSDLHSNTAAIRSFAKSLVDYDCGVIAGDIINEMIPEDEIDLYFDNFNKDDIVPFLPDANMTFDEEIDHLLANMHKHDGPLYEALQKKEQHIKEILCEAEKPIFLIGGNHDNVEWADYNKYIINIHNKKVEFLGYNFVGYKWTRMGRSPKDHENDVLYLKTLVDENTILVTHEGPAGILKGREENAHAESKELLKLSKAKVHIFGHIHSQGGQHKGKYVNVAFPRYKKFYSIELENKPIETDKFDTNLSDKKIVKSVLQGKNCSNCIFFTNSYASLNKKYCIIHYKNIKNPKITACNRFSNEKNRTNLNLKQELAIRDGRTIGKLQEINEDDDTEELKPHSMGVDNGIATLEEMEEFGIYSNIILNVYPLIETSDV